MVGIGWAKPNAVPLRLTWGFEGGGQMEGEGAAANRGRGEGRGA